MRYLLLADDVFIVMLPLGNVGNHFDCNQDWGIMKDLMLLASRPEADQMKPVPWSTSKVDAVGRGSSILLSPSSTWFDGDDINDNDIDDEE